MLWFQFDIKFKSFKRYLKLILLILNDVIDWNEYVIDVDRLLYWYLQATSTGTKNWGMLRPGNIRHVAVLYDICWIDLIDWIGIRVYVPICWLMWHTWHGDWSVDV